jgi:hypothetical protein
VRRAKAGFKLYFMSIAYHLKVYASSLWSLDNKVKSQCVIINILRLKKCKPSFGNSGAQSAA